jgi:hypothetical protein
MYIAERSASGAKIALRVPITTRFSPFRIRRKFEYRSDLSSVESRSIEPSIIFCKRWAEFESGRTIRVDPLEGEFEIVDAMKSKRLTTGGIWM